MARKLVVEIIGDASSLNRSLKEATVASNRFGKEVSHSLRGVASGTGIMHGFGRSLAFASGGFLAFEGVSHFLNDSVKAAIDAGVAQRSLTAQMKTSGESFAASKDAIEQANLGLAKFGFTSEDAVHAVTVLERGTGNIQQALSLETVSADLARAKNIDLASAATVVSKVFGGQETALRRAVPGLEKNAHGLELIRLAQQRLAGQAAAGTTAGERFAASLHDTEVIIGTALLPTLNKALTGMSDWLDRMNSNVKPTDAFSTAVLKLGHAFKFAAGAAGDAKSVWDKLPGSIQGGLLGILGKGGGAPGALKNIISAMGGGKGSPLDLLFGGGGGGGRPGGNLFSPGYKLPSFGLPPPPPPHDLPTVQAALPIVGRAGLTPMQRNALALSAAARTQSTKDDLAALATQRQLLAKAIQTETARLNQATSAGAAKKFADNLQKLQDKDAAAFNQIVSISKQGQQQAGRTAAELAGQRNTWFDTAIGRMLDRVQDIPQLQDQIARLRTIAGLIQQQIDAAKDVTRKQTLGDTLAGVFRTIKADQDQVTQNAADAATAATERKATAQQALIDQLQFNVDRTDLTKGQQDNLKALQAYKAGLEKIIATEGSTLALQQQLLGVELNINSKNQEIADAAKARKDAAKQAAQDAAAAAKAAREQAATLRSTRQFRALGFGPGGADLIPGAEALRKRLGNIGDQLTGTFLDTRKTKSLFSHIRQVLSGGLGAVGGDVRSKVKEILDGIDQQLKDHRGDQTRFRHVSSAAFVDSLGLHLSPLERTRLRMRVSQIGAGGTVPNRNIQFGGGPAQIVIHSATFHGVTDMGEFEQQLTKRAKSRAHTRRGG